MAITHINPDSLHSNPAFAQGVLVEGGRTLYIGGQNGTDSAGAIVGDLAAQSEQAARNVLAVVEAAGGSPRDIVKLTILLVEGGDLLAAYQAAMTVFAGIVCAVTVAVVRGLARPDALLEIEGVAALAHLL
jgi:enamine deaminase RidA (YjgF/YER057c/UK114 family)